ncbi:hypothetical protein [Psychrobacter sp. I-STPA10]|uniref:hypothetical protein n=1 Tax=Psychrobacter sp. I-STPA10 TaxID=2585769 RepID=UPI001E354752|nr:hypothetical protein [Psychrobacter sp. I-STPA10]
MKLYLGDGSSIDGSDLISAIYRTDLVPVPVSLELVVKANDKLKELLNTGHIITTNQDIQLEVVKSQIINTQSVKDGKRIAALHIIAVLAGCSALLGVASRATSLTNTSFNEAYRALGAKLRIKDDMKLGGFICLKGHLPTVRIAAALQKEAAVVRFFDNRLSIIRINELFNGDATPYDKSTVQFINNPNAIRHDNTNYLTIDDDGTQIIGNAHPQRAINYYPRAQARELQNLRRILVTKATITRQLDEQLNAGNLVSIEGQKYVVLTGVHRYDSGVLGGAPITATRAWLAQISEQGALI